MPHISSIVKEISKGQAKVERSCYEIPWCGLYKIKIHRKHPEGAKITFLLRFCVLYKDVASLL